MRINRKIVASLNIRTSKDGKYCDYLCTLKDEYDYCGAYGCLDYEVAYGGIKRHPKCIKDEVSEDYYKKEKK